MDNRLDPISTIAYYYRVKAKSARKCYKQKKDGYKDWNQAAHCGEYLVFPENLTPHLAIDEVNFILKVNSTLLWAPETAQDAHRS